ncbi:MAG: hypothetical protein DSO07_08500 [Thermoproteota archaeon]|uniref:Uncharacterized protein n=1 Tax=Candidatus Methanodesulfokora washburnensis TaxID=2478471 RepID=A0A3R9PT04_9CREN|nr:hypothetical protein D6D85_14275 [Candidatus Methanodesulfokores washburnensis]TDA40688.1 MAG: hypothetical protein DSO07_08500 [Candidatus Korarchaeota archaeon]
MSGIVGNVGWIKWVNKPIMNASALMSDDTACELVCLLEGFSFCFAICVPAELAGGPLAHLACDLICEIIFHVVVCQQQCQ